MNVLPLPPPPPTDSPPGDISSAADGAPENFPVTAFPPLMRSIAEEMCTVYKVPTCLPAMTAMAVLSGAVGKSVVVAGAFADRPTRLNIYVIAVADRGSGKGIVGDTLCEPLMIRSKALTKMHATIAAGRRGELEVLQQDIQRLIKMATGQTGQTRESTLGSLSTRYAQVDEMERESKQEKTLWVGDTTSESLARALMFNNEVLFSYSAEAGGLIKVALGKYTDSGDFELLLSGYSGDPYKADRITRDSVQLDKPCLSVLWLVQPSIIRRLVGDAEAFARGLTARPLTFDSGARREHDNGDFLKFTLGHAWADLINGVIDRQPGSGPPKEIICTTEARKAFAAFHNTSVDLERGPYADITGELSRWRENAIKVAGLFALAEGLDVITEAMAQRAIAVVRWCGYNYIGLLQSGRRERLRGEMERLLELVREHGGEVNLGVLARAHGIKRTEVDAIIAAFPAHLVIVKRQQQGAGRPAEVVTVPAQAGKPSSEG